jgi:hypothetical protein
MTALTDTAMPVLAHQGGWDELLLAAGIVLAVLGTSAFRTRRRGRGAGAARARPGACPYCDAPLPPGTARCAECGFRVPSERP